jgi:hypothetical protein
MKTRVYDVIYNRGNDDHGAVKNIQVWKPETVVYLTYSNPIRTHARSKRGFAKALDALVKAVNRMDHTTGGNCWIGSITSCVNYKE